MFEKFRTRTLWIIAIVSGACFLISPILATPIGSLADSILLERFKAAWLASHDTSPWSYMAAGENIFTFTTYAIAFIALVSGSMAVWMLYKRKHDHV